MIWGISGFVYLAIIIASYSVHANMNPKTDKVDHSGVEGHKEENTNNHHIFHDQTNDSAKRISKVAPQVSYEKGIISIALKDDNNHVPKLEVSHEKFMHVIVVSSDLDEYYHLHPEQKNNGVFSQKFHLSDNTYKVFIDIKPKDQHYTVEPIEIQVGNKEQEHKDNDHVVDTDFIKTINGQTVELTTRSFEANKEITLNFKVKDAMPEPYLGALGHVVILDEEGKTFIHVHPV